MTRGWDAGVVALVTETVKRHQHGDTSTVAAAGRDEQGDLHVAMNVFHFTGGPCAALALLGAVAAKGRSLASIVAVGSDDRVVLPPCGRCRQVLLDLAPTIEVLLPGEHVAMPADLLPSSYEWVNTER